MCSSGGQIAQTDQALQASQAAMTSTLNSDYSTTFAEQQSLLGNLQAKMNYVAANPMGYSAPALAAARTSINESTSTAAKQAIGSAAAFAASHGGADVGSGVTGQLAGQIASGAAQSKSQQLTALTQQNEEMKQKNFWNAISGLNSVGSELGGAGGTAIGGATSTAGSSVGAGSGALAAKQAGWQNLGGVLSGIAGLGTAAAGFSLGGGAADPYNNMGGTLPLAPSSTGTSSVY
jgi:hypothetical protein